MKLPALALTLLLSLAAPLVAAEAPPTDTVLIDHTKVAAAFAQGMPMLVNSSYKIQAGRRVAAGTAEVHASDTDIFYVTEGEAIFVTGGKPVNPKTTGPGEVRADKLEGGTARKLVKGDVIVIPAGVPHWFSEVNGTFLYFVIKVTK